MFASTEYVLPKSPSGVNQCLNLCSKFSLYICDAICTSRLSGRSDVAIATDLVVLLRVGMLCLWLGVVGCGVVWGRLGWN